MATPSFTQRELEKVIGAHLLPLKESWEETRGTNQRWEQVFQYHAEQEHELFLAESEQKDNNKTFILARIGEYFYTGIWVDPDDSYDVAILSQDYESALVIAEERLDLSPESADYLFDKAYALAGLERRQEALEYYDQILLVEPENVAALQNKAVQLALLGRTDEAEKYHDKALAVDPDHITANISKLHYLAEKGQLDSYYDQLEKIIQIDPSDVEERLLLAGFKKEKDIQSLDDVKVQRERFVGAPGANPEGPILH